MTDFSEEVRDHEHITVVTEYRVTCHHCPIAQMVSDREEDQDKQVLIFEDYTQAQTAKDVHDEHRDHRCMINVEDRAVIDDDAPDEEAEEIAKLLLKESMPTS